MNGDSAESRDWDSQDGNVEQGGADVGARAEHRETHIAAEEGVIQN